MEEGLVSPVDKGTPQGGPPSPLLSNLVLDELDWELERRGRHFARYADCTSMQSSNLWGASPLIPIVRSGISQEVGLKARANGLSDLERRCKSAGSNIHELVSAS